MDHAEAREILELAAVEPGGLDRLVAGDTPEAIALAGHLAGCTECTDEFTRLRRSTPILREVIASRPPAELRDRTLAFVAAVGRPRGAAIGASSGGAATADAISSSPAATVDRPAEPIAIGPGARATRAPRPPGRIRAAWLAAAAVLVIVASAATAFVVTWVQNDVREQQANEVEGLAAVASWTLKLDATPDSHRVMLADAAQGGAPGAGSLIFSPTTREMVVVASGLTDPGPNREYRCWVEVNGARQRLGRMYFGADLAYWVGDVEVLSAVKPGSTFGISLVDRSGSNGGSPPILSGSF